MESTNPASPSQTASAIAPDSPSSPLLCLPRELRFEIYDYLCRQEPKSYPFRQPPITCIDQRGPPTALLTTCRYLYEEIQAYFHSKVTFTLHSENVRRTRLADMDAASLHALRQAKKIHVVLCWTLHLNRRDSDLCLLRYSMVLGLTELVEFLLFEQIDLELVTVSVMDGLHMVDWDSKRRLLEPLDRLAGRVRFRAGNVVSGGDELDLEIRIKDYVKELNRVVLPACG